MADELELKPRHRAQLRRDLTLNQERSRLELGRWLWTNAKPIVGALLLGLFVASLWACFHAAVVARWIHPKQEFADVLPTMVTEFGVVLAAVLAALVIGPKALKSAVAKTSRPASEQDDEFSRAFRKLLRIAKKERDVIDRLH